LERQFLSNGQNGFDLVKKTLINLLLEGMRGDEFEDDKNKPHYSKWIENQVQEAIFNSIVPYTQIYGTICAYEFYEFYEFYGPSKDDKASLLEFKDL
jgi:hypothetical protein